MAVTLALSPIPFWYFTDGSGKPCINGQLWTYAADNHDLKKPTYSSNVLLPINLLPNPIILDGTGTINSPIYWLHGDTSLYYLELYDQDGNLVRSVDNYPIDSGGGSGPITVLQDVENFAVNGQFRFINALPSPTVANTEIPISRGNWFFSKDSASTTNEISFPTFVLADTDPSSNPRHAFKYSDPGPITTETFKDLYIKFPDVKTFSNQIITVSFQAKGSTAANAQVFAYQFFGSGGSSPVDTPQASQPITIGSYTNIITTFTVPSVGGKFRGAGNDDYLAIGVRFALDVVGDFEFTNFQIELSNVASATYIYDGPLNDQYRTVQLRDVFTTGDVKFSYASSLAGWLLMDDNTLGKINTATHFGPVYYDLYKFLWDHVLNAYCPVSGGRGASALDDWNANKTLRLPLTAERVAANTGGILDVGFAEGSSTYTLVLANLPAHDHSLDFGTGGAGYSTPDYHLRIVETPTGTTANSFVVTSAANFSSLGVATTTQLPLPTAAATAFSIKQLTAYINQFIKL